MKGNEFWLERLMDEHCIKSRYELSKRTGVGEMTLSHIVKRKTPPLRVSYGVMRSIAIGLGLNLDELDKKIN